MARKTYENIDRPYSSLLQRSKGMAYQLGDEDQSIASGNTGMSGQSGGGGEGGSVEQKTIKTGQNLGDLWITNFIRSENWKPKTQGFTIDGNTGYAEFSNVYVSGSLTLNTTSSISGGQTDYDTGTGFFLGYSGGAYKFSVGVGGTGPSLKWDGTSLTSTGASIVAPGASTDVSLLDYTHDITFSSSDENTVAWTSGTIRFSNGQNYAIAASNTGNMAGAGYVYFSIASPTILQFDTSASNVSGANKIVVAKAAPGLTGSGESTFQVFGGAGGLKVGSSALNIANNNWTYSGTFSVTDADTVEWSNGGILKVSNGTQYTISNGTTYNMTAKTYIYFDIATPTQFKTTQSSQTAVGDGKILVAVAENGTSAATFFVMNEKQASISGSQLANGSVPNTKIVAGSITATEMASNSITAGKIAANAVTVGTIAANAVVANSIAAGQISGSHLSVTNLGALKADLGTITAGTITLNTSGYIRSGQTAYNTGTGWWLGVDSVPKFSIGNPNGAYMTWDGTALDSSNMRLAYTFTAKEAISTGNTVAIIPPTGVAATEYASYAGNASGWCTTCDAALNRVPYIAISFYTTANAAGITELQFGEMIVCQSSDGTHPSGVVLVLTAWDGVSTSWSTIWSYNLTSSRPFWSLPNSGKFSNLNITVSPSTRYAVFILPNSWPSNKQGSDFKIRNGTGRTGEASAPELYFNGTDTDPAWTLQPDTPCFGWKEKVWGADAGKIVKASAQSSNDGRYTGYLGISQQNISAGSAGKVVINGLSTVHSGALTIGSSYYLSNTLGEISTTPGTTSKTVGRAVSSSNLLLGS